MFKVLTRLQRGMKILNLLYETIRIAILEIYFRGNNNFSFCSSFLRIIQFLLPTFLPNSFKYDLLLIRIIVISILNFQFDCRQVHP